jgi:Na+-translocating ferredoxin:NAD+ oxidoreductase RnfE subunit
MEVEKPRTQPQTPIEGYTPLDAFSAVEETRRHRFSALVDGICIGVGVVFILLGALMPITSAGMLVQGLMSIIGGLVVSAVGMVVEVYHWAKLHQ